MLQARDDPESIASIAFQRIVFGSGHRYGTGAVGTEATLKTFKPGDLRAFHAAWYQPAHAHLVVVGDVRLTDVIALLEKHFGGWKNGASIKRMPVPVAAL